MNDTELRDQLEAAVHAAIIESQKHNIGRQPAIVADAVLPFIEDARKQGWHEAAASYNEEVIPIERADAREQVVEGLVATIKARRAESLVTRDDMTLADSVGWAAAQDVATLDWVLAVVEAARENTDD